MSTPPNDNPAPLLQYQQAYVPLYPADWTNIRFHALAPDKLAHFLQLRLILRFTIQFITAAITLCFILWFYQAHKLPLSLIYGPALAVIFIIALGAFRTARRTRRDWESFRLVVSDQGLKRTLAGYPDLTILNHEITRIVETPVSLIIHTNRRQTVLPLNRALENFSELQAHLHRIRPTTRDRWRILRSSALLLAQFLFSALALTAYFGGIVSRNLPLEILCLIVLFLFVLITFLRSLFNPNLPRLRKYTQLIALLLPLILALKILAFHLFHIK